jgi:uncharacterized protein YodC (DUF2158 family)
MFKAGDVVQLKSGGPLMTILEVASRDGRDMVHCIWAAGTDEKSSWYPQEVLKMANNGPMARYIGGPRRRR